MRAVTVTYLYTCWSGSGWFAGKRTSSPDPRCAGLSAPGEIVILEEGPFVFRVVQEVQLGLIDSTGTLKAIRPSIPNRFEWICSSKEAATEQALKCLQQSKNENWLLSPSASSAA